MTTFQVNGQPYTMATYHQTFQKRPTIEVAVKNNSAIDDPEETIARHHQRLSRLFADRHPGAGKNISLTVSDS